MELTPDLVDSAARHCHVALSLALAVLVLARRRALGARAPLLATAFLADVVRVVVPDGAGGETGATELASALAVAAASLVFFPLLVRAQGSSLPAVPRLFALAVASALVAAFGLEMLHAGDPAEGYPLPLPERLAFFADLAAAAGALGWAAARVLVPGDRAPAAAVLIVAASALAVDVLETRGIGAFLSWPHASAQAGFLLGQAVMVVTIWNNKVK